MLQAAAVDICVEYLTDIHCLCLQSCVTHITTGLGHILTHLLSPVLAHHPPLRHTGLPRPLLPDHGLIWTNINTELFVMKINLSIISIRLNWSISIIVVGWSWCCWLLFSRTVVECLSSRTDVVVVVVDTHISRLLLLIGETVLMLLLLLKSQSWLTSISEPRSNNWNKVSKTNKWIFWRLWRWSYPAVLSYCLAAECWM